MRFLVTGGCGFIGSNFIRHVIEARPDWEIVNLDKLTYAGNPANLADLRRSPRYRFIRGDISTPSTAVEAMKDCQAVVHFAAETHVDRSILEPDRFLKTNVLGTMTLMKAALEAGVERFLHVGTDEVYGDVPAPRQSKESDPLLPNSPYAASKAAADHIARAFHRTYGLPVVVTRCSNNFGPYQYPEKVIPLWITNALEDKPLPLYGDGKQIRDWLYVTDHAKALLFVLERGAPGEIYNIGGTHACTNLDLARSLLSMLGKPHSLIQAVADRPAHDRRYALDCSKLETLGWKPETPFVEALEATISWYRVNEQWWRKLKKRADYRSYYQKQYAKK